ncbi:hypothetical protein D3C83_185390 [compost metagenome]
MMFAYGAYHLLNTLRGHVIYGSNLVTALEPRAFGNTARRDFSNHRCCFRLKPSEADDAQKITVQISRGHLRQIKATRM